MNGKEEYWLKQYLCLSGDCSANSEAPWSILVSGLTRLLLFLVRNSLLWTDYCLFASDKTAAVLQTSQRQ